MTVPCHSAVAAIVVLGMGKRPWWAKLLALVALFLTHFIFDLVPHRHYFEATRLFSIGPYNAISAIAESFTCLAMLYLVCLRTGVSPFALLIAVSSSILPDPLVGGHIQPFSFWNETAHRLWGPHASVAQEVGWEICISLVLGIVLSIIAGARRKR